jgi:hypothetical protein
MVLAAETRKYCNECRFRNQNRRRIAISLSKTGQQTGLCILYSIMNHIQFSSVLLFARTMPLTPSTLHTGAKTSTELPRPRAPETQSASELEATARFEKYWRCNGQIQIWCNCNLVRNCLHAPRQAIAAWRLLGNCSCSAPLCCVTPRAPAAASSAPCTTVCAPSPEPTNFMNMNEVGIRAKKTDPDPRRKTNRRACCSSRGVVLSDRPGPLHCESRHHSLVCRA